LHTKSADIADKVAGYPYRLDLRGLPRGLGHIGRRLRAFGRGGEGYHPPQLGVTPDQKIRVTTGKIYG